MRILHVVPLSEDQLDGDGRAAVVLNQCLELRARGHEVQLLVWWRHGGAPDPQAIDGLPTHLIGGRQGWRRWLRRNVATFDLVHVHLDRDPAIRAAAEAAEAAGLPYVVQPQGTLARYPSRRVGRVVRRASICLAVDAHERDLLSWVVSRRSDDPSPIPAVEMIRDGVRLAESPGGRARPTGPVPAPARRAPLDVLCVGSAATLDVPLLARTLRAVLQRGLDARFTLAGPDGALDPAWADLLLDHPRAIGRLVTETMPGHDALRERLARADVVLQATRPGARSVMLLEALSAGVATVCTDTTPNAELVRSRRAGCVTPADPDALADALVRLARNPAERAELAERGRMVAELQFDVGRVVDDIEDGYARAMVARYPLGEDDDGPTRAAAARAWHDHSTRRRLVIDLSADDSTDRPEPVVPEGDGAPDTLEKEDSLLWVCAEVTGPRLALWRQTARHTNLTVALLARDEANLALTLLGSSEPFHVVHLAGRGRRGGDRMSRAAVNRTLRALIDHRPDCVVLDGEPDPALRAAARWARRRSISVLAAFTAPEDAEAPVSRALRRQLRSADAVLATGAHSAREAARLGVAVDRVTVTEVRPDVPSTERREGRTVVDVRRGHRFLFARPLLAKNNAEALLKAFRLARAADDVLVVAGTGPMYPRLMELVDHLDLRRHVVLTGPPTDAAGRARLLADAHTVVLPSPDALWAQDAEEALDAGRQVVASRDLEASSEMTRRPGMFLCEPNPADLARAMMLSRQRWNLVHRAGLDPATADRGIAAIDPAAITIVTA